MSQTPVSIFSHRISPAAVARKVRELFPDMEIDDVDIEWTAIEAIVTPGSLFRKAKKLSLRHREDYYSTSNWQRQKLGLQNLVRSFPGGEGRWDLVELIQSFQFIIGAPLEDLGDPKTDPRWPALLAICKKLDGIVFVFTTASLLDAEGRTIIDSSGSSSADARLPKLPPADGVYLAESIPDASDDVYVASLTGDETGNETGTEDVYVAELSGNEAEDRQQPVPPDAQRVAARLVALTAVAGRATIELDNNDGNATDDEYLRHAIVDWVRSLGIDDELEPEEWKALQRPIGSLERQSLVNAMWRVEGLAVLAWAVNLHTLPCHETIIEPPELYEAIGVPQAEKTQTILDAVKLRPIADLQDMRKHLTAAHWRLREYSITPKAMDFVAFSKDCWLGSFDVSRFRIIDGDMAIGDVPIHDADPKEIARVNSIAMERHQAINWLCGASRLYSQTDTST